MLNPQFFYREEKPSADVSHLILSFWEFRVGGQITSPTMHEVFPDGCVSLCYYRNQINRIFFSEITRKSIFVPVNAGDTFWGMRILPEACALFFGRNPDEIKTADFEDEILSRQLQTCEDFAEVIEKFEDFARNSGVESTDIDPRLAKATRIFVDTKGLAKISETAREVGLSERQLERNYQKASGLTPKQFARIARFRATAIDMVNNEATNFARRAADKGFTDQSHLNREFSNLTGNSPTTFLQKLKRIKHEKLSG